MASIRRVKTSSGATAVQVVEYRDRRVAVLKHIGSTHTPEELTRLIAQAETWQKEYSGQELLIPALPQTPLTHWDGRQFVGVRYGLLYDVCQAAYSRLGFADIDDTILRDLCIMRLFQPASKVRSLELLERSFDIRHGERTLYRHLPLFLSYKVRVEEMVQAFAKSELKDDLSIVLYDVTTLYFESFDADELRKPGFSKDSKSQQPQIVVGLLVSPDGFPFGQETFSGNTFEGKTMLPVLRAFRDAQQAKRCTVVADAAMLSLKNMEDLRAESWTYIVGGRIANLSPKVLDQICLTLKDKRDGASVRISTAHGDLICGYSSKRERKDRFEMERQLAKAQTLIARQEPGRRAKFVQKGEHEEAYALNEALKQKTERLLGIKGYYTNIPEQEMSDTDVIARYGNLWRVEQSFRMSKNDLVARPIFHRKEDSVRAHMIICFMALAMGRYLEYLAGFSLRRIMDLLGQVPDARLQHIQTKKEILLRAPIHEKLGRLLTQLRLSH